MRVFFPIVGSLADYVVSEGNGCSYHSSCWSPFIGYDFRRRGLVVFHRFSQELPSRCGVASGLVHDFEHLTFHIDCAPKIHLSAIELQEHLVNVPG